MSKYLLNMNTATLNENEVTSSTLVNAINNASEVQIDGAWAILKYKEIGI